MATRYKLEHLRKKVDRIYPYSTCSDTSEISACQSAVLEITAALIELIDDQIDEIDMKTESEDGY